MNWPSALCLFLIVASPVSAQRADRSPLGVLITPPPKIAVSKEIQALLPGAVAVRLIQSTKMASEGEQVIVYERGNQYEPHSHVAVVVNGHRVADFSLIELFKKEGVGSSYALFKTAEFTAADKRNMFIAAFRNIGDGAGTLFVLVAQENGHYQVVWRQGTIQGRFKVLRSGKIQVWGADGGGECVWCPQKYVVDSFEWMDGTLSRVSHFETNRSLSPGQISEIPIVIEK